MFAIYQKNLGNVTIMSFNGHTMLPRNTAKHSTMVAVAETEIVLLLRKLVNHHA